MDSLDSAYSPVLRRAAMYFLARREHSSHELKIKLNRKFSGVSQILMLEVLSSLAAEGLQSDERYTESRIRYRQERGFGYHHIRNELISKGVDPYLIDKKLHPDDDCWLHSARELVEKRLSTSEDGSYQEISFASPQHKKLTRFLEARGFAQRDIRAALEGIIAT